MTELGNPAGRLHALLTALRKHPAQTEAIGIAMGKYLNAQYPNEMSKLLRSLARVYEMPSEVRAEAAIVPMADPSILIKRLPEIETALGKLQLNQRLDKWNALVSETAMDGLETCSSFIQQYRRQRTLGEEQRTELRGRLDELIADVQASDELDNSLRMILLDHLHEMLRAVDDYLVSGVEGLDRAVQRIWGQMGLHPEAAETVRQTTVGERIERVVMWIAAFVTIAAGAPQLAAGSAAKAPSLYPGRPPVVIEVGELPPGSNLVVSVDGDAETQDPAPETPETTGEVDEADPDGDEPSE